MTLRRLLRVTGFRLLLLYSALFILSVSILFSVVSLAVGKVATQQVDGDVREELSELMEQAGSVSLPGIAHAMLTASSAPDDRMHYLLQDAQRRRIFGDLDPMTPRAGAFTLTVEGLRWRIRGRGVRLPDGFMYVGEDEIQQTRLAAALRDSFLLTIGLMLALAILGGVLMSAGVLRRIDSISRTSRAIMAGDLSRRIPLNGSEDEFDQLARVLNQMLGRIEALMEGVRQVSAGIAHDLRTPLTRMRQRLEIAASSDSEAALRDGLTRSIGDIESLLVTFSALLRIGQIESGSRRGGFARVELGALVRTLAEAYEPLAEERGHAILTAVAEEVWVEGDSALLTQMLANLLENAIHHCPQPGPIRIELARIEHGRIELARIEHARIDHGRVGRAAELSVSDRGPGIAPAQRDLALRRFGRLGDEGVAGSGLGLAMVAAIVALHEGSLRLEDNAPGLRVVIRLALPRGR